MGGSSPSTQTVRNVTEVDPVTQAWRQAIFQQGGALYNKGIPAYYPGQTVVPFSNQTQAGLNALQTHAQGGAPNLQAANDASARALSGWNPAAPYATQFASGQNPLLQGVSNAANQNVAPSIAPMIQGGTAANPLLGAIAQSGAASNPYAGAVMQAGGQNTAGQLAPWLMGASGGNPFVSAVAQSGAAQNPFAPALANASGQQTTAGVNTLQNAASGGAMNPYLDSLFSAASRPVTDAVNAQFAKAGRYGSPGAHAGTLTRELGNLASSIYAPAYEAERGRQLASAGQLAGLQQNDMARNLSALGMGADVVGQDLGRALTGYSQAAGLTEAGYGRRLDAGGLFNQALQSDASRRLSAAGAGADIFGADRAATMQGLGQAGSLFEAGASRGLAGADLMGGLASGDAARRLQGASTAAGLGLSGTELLGATYSQGNQDAARAQALLPGLFGYGQMPGQALMDVGGIYEGLAGQYMADDRARYDYAANAPWDLLQRYSGMMSGLPDFSNSTQTQTGPGQNRLMSGLGGAAAGAGIASALGATGPIGWGLAGAGGLLGLFG